MKNFIYKIYNAVKTSILIAACGILLAMPSGVNAQDSQGTDFWVMFNKNYDMSAVTLTIFITSAVNTSGTVSGPSLSSIPFTVAANTVTSVVVPTTLGSHTNDVVGTNGIHITSIQNVTVYGLNRQSFTTDAYLGLPTDALGTDYTVLSYKNNFAGDLNSVSMGIVGTVNGTVVTITPSVTTLSHTAGVPYNITLNQGSTYELRNATNSVADLTGTRITSTQPVGVFGAHTCANIIVGCSYCDHICEMLPPTSTWGKKFVTVPLVRTIPSAGDPFKVLARDNATTVTLNGVAQSPVLNAGQSLEINLTASSIIEADKPVLMAQYAKGSTCGGNPGDPFMMLIPPYEQFFSGYTVTTVGGFTNHYINIVAPTSSVGSMTRNGVAIPSGSFTPIGASGFSGAQISVASGSHTLSGALPFGSFMYGFNQDDSYGYAGGQSYSPIALVTSLVLTAEATTAEACNSVCWNALVSDQFNNPLAGIRVDFNIYGASSANSGFANTNVNGVAHFCYTGYAGLDSIIASVNTVRDTLTFTWTPSSVVGTPTVTNNSPICDGGTLNLTASASGATSYLWTGPNGFTSALQNPSIPSATTAASGTYTVAVNGCAGATTTVTVNPSPGTFTPTSNSPICEGNTLNLSAVASGGSTYSWSGPNGFTSALQSPTIPAATIAASGTYLVTAFNAAGCPRTSSIVVTVAPGLLSGTYTVGVGGNYTTLTAAVAAYNGACSIGPLVFELTDATYTSPSETFPISINNRAGTSSVNTLIIRPASSNVATISGSSSTSIIKFNGADWVIIDGSNSGGSTRNLTVRNTSTAANTAAIWVSSLGVGLGANNNTIKNTNIYAGSTGTTVINFGIYSDGTTISSTGTGSDNDNLTIQNNQIGRAYYGIYVSGTATAKTDALSIISNTIGSTVASDYLSTFGIRVAQVNNFNISLNEVMNVTNAIALNPFGIQLSTGSTNGTVSRNNVHDIVYTGTGGWGGKGIDIQTGTAASNITVSNNFINNISGDGWTTLNSDANVGIRIDGNGVTGGVNVYFNTVNLFGSISRAASTADLSAAIYIGPSASALNIRNNIFVNTLNNTTGTAIAYAIYSSAAASAFTTINNNDYFVSGPEGILGFLGSNRTTLAAWQGATLQDGLSKNVNPVFVSSTNIHLVPGSNPVLDNGGLPVSGITVDFDGDLRNAATPDIGADEIVVCTMPTVSCPANITVPSAAGQCGANASFAATATGTTPTITYSHAPGSFFNVGTTTVTATATNACGTSSCTFTVTVNDNQNPVISGVGAYATINCPAVPAFSSPTASDNCSATLTFADVTTTGCGNTYTTTRTWTATDPSSNSVTASQTIIVQDVTPPTITSASDQTAECDGTGNTAALNAWLANNGGATASDACSGVTWSNNFTSLSDLCGATGAATVTFTATDDCGNASASTATFTIVDTTVPAITAASSQTEECDGAGNSTGLNAWLANNGGATASDVCSGVTWSNNFISLSDLCGATGAATVIFTATDDCGNASTSTATFTIVDTTVPAITAASSQTEECDGTGNTTALNAWLANNGGATASDVCSGVTWSNNFTSLSDLCGATGAATVTFTATDDCGNASSSTATFTIVDTTVPVIACAGNITANNTTGLCGTNVTYAASATDNCSGAPAITYSIAPGSFFDVGITYVTATATDACGNTNTCSFDVTVNDTESPAITCSGNQTVSNDPGVCGAVVNYNVSYSDNCPGPLMVVSYSIPASGAVFPVGTNSYSVVVTDGSGNSSSCTFSITVNDTENPTIACPGTVNINSDPGQCFATVALGTPVTDDNCGVASITNNAPATFPIGATTVTWTVTDIYGNTANCQQTVNVTDNENPVITCVSNIVATVNTSGCRSLVTYSLPSYSDNCTGSMLTQTAGLASGSAFPTGTTTNTFVVTDASGNIATCSFTVTVNSTLSVNAGINESTFFGYSGDQTVTHTASASGGTGPYSYSWTMDRPLFCNQVNLSGDEIFNGGSCLNNTCPSSGPATLNPVCSGSASVTVKLMDTTDVCVTVTDAFGCTFTDCFTIMAEDARCFNGSNNNDKVKICHHTNSVSNPWVQICISDNAVAAHLANNPDDYLGNCVAIREGEQTASVEHSFDVYPNPAHDKVNLSIGLEEAAELNISLIDITGRMVHSEMQSAKSGLNNYELSLTHLSKGVYLLHVQSVSEIRKTKIVVE